MENNETQEVFMEVVRVEKALRKILRSESVAGSECEGVEVAADHLRKIAVRMFEYSYRVLTEKI